MIYFAILFIPALIITIIAKLYYHKDICGKENLISVGLNILCAGVFVGIILMYTNSKIQDQYLVTGSVISKQQVKVSCEHSYECNCYNSCSGSGSSQTCTRICQTCYRHSHDYNWRVNTSVGSLNISRIDSQGKNIPPRFNSVVIGEPATFTKRFHNYLLADPNSLFNYNSNVNFNTPTYPSVYDYYKVNRVFGVSKDSEMYNSLINNHLINKTYNVILITTPEEQQYSYSLLEKWKGSKLNDVVLIFGVGQDDKVKWFYSDSYSKGLDNRYLHDKLRISNLGEQFNLDLVQSNLNLIDEQYKQVDNHQFEHLKHNIKVPFWVLFIVFGINIMVSVGVSYYMKENTL